MKRAARDGALLLGLGAAVWYFVFRTVSLGELRAALAGARPEALAAAVGAMGLYFLCDACNTARGLRRLGHRPGRLRCLQYAAAGFFFSSITPSSTGGQPMQICYMRKDGVDPAHGALVLLLELACWQAVTAVFGVAGLWLSRGIFAQLPGAMQLLAAAGTALNLLLLAGVLAAVFRPAWAERAGCRVAHRLRRRPRAARFWAGVQTQLKRFSESAPLIRSSPGLLVSMLLTTALQLAALYSVPFWVHRALGLSGWSLPAMAALQAMVSLSVGALPLPGAVGVGEGGFLAVFRMLFPSQLLGGAMLLSRGISFYLFVLLTGAALLCRWVWERRPRRMPAA